MKFMWIIPILAMIGCDDYDGRPSHVRVEPVASAWAESMGMKVRQVKCVDSKRSCFISCTVASGGDGEPRLTSIKCADPLCIGRFSGCTKNNGNDE